MNLMLPNNGIKHRCKNCECAMGFQFSRKIYSNERVCIWYRNNAKPLFKAKYKFKYLGKMSIACRVQDDLGGEKINVEIISVR